MEKSKSLKKLINQYNEVNNLNPGILFTDSYFPQSDKSIFNSNSSYKNKKYIKPQIFLSLDSDFSKSQFTSLSKDVKYTWKSISDYIKDYNIIKNSNISIDDIIQGNIGNSYFISALKFLAEEPSRIISLFDFKEENNKNKEINYFEVFTYINGYKSKIIIDDKFPFIENKENIELAFCRINDKTNNIWPLILEKVWAKINSSYEDIIEGNVSDIFYFYTPNPIKIYHHDIKYNNLFDKIKNAIDNDFIVCADINSQKENLLLNKLGVLSNHAYRIIGYGTLLDSNGNLYNLIKIKNNYEITSWIGDWGPGSIKWSDEFKRYLNYNPEKEKNVFYISINDYLKFYSNTYILYWHQGYNYFFNKINITGINEPFSCCKIIFSKINMDENNQKNVTYFIINTKNKRIQKNFKHKNNFENIFKNIYLYKKAENENLILIDSICGKEERLFLSISNEYIKENDEFILFISFPYLDSTEKKINLKKNFSINPNRPNNICVGVYTDILKENADLKIESINNLENMEKYIIKSLYEKSKYNSHLYYFDKEKERDSSRSINFENEKGAYGYLVIDNRSNGVLYEKLTFFDYDNINILYFVNQINTKQKNNLYNNPNNNTNINTELIFDINKREIINNLLKEKYINSYEETKLNLISLNDKEKSPFDLLIKLGSKTMLLLIFEKCDEFASINIKSQINFLYPLYMIISEKKINANITNKLEYRDKKVEIYENIMEYNSGVVFYYSNKEKELNARINIAFKEIKNLGLDMTSDLLELKDKNGKKVKIIKENNDNDNCDIVTGIEIELNCFTNVFFALKAKNIFENFSYSFENKYTIYY